METSNLIQSVITLQGSSEIVCDYLDFGVNSILYQRGIYPSEEFRAVQNYELPLYMTQNKKIREFLNATLGQLKEWLNQGVVSKVSLVITNHKTQEVVERWEFKVEVEGDPSIPNENKVSHKPLKIIQSEIRDIMRQIVASVAFLPLLEAACSFDLQIHTASNVKVPELWEESECKEIKNAQSVNLRTFSTNIHKIKTAVTYQHTV